MILKKSVGIDISDRTIEVAKISAFGSKIKIKSLGRGNIPPGVVSHGRILDKKQLADILKKVLKDSQPSSIKPRNVIFGLPESRVYTRVFELSPHEKKKRHELILKEAKGSIPLKEDDLLFTYSVLSENKEKVEILLVGVSKEVFKEWEAFFKELRIKVRAFDVETLANIRGVFSKKPDDTIAVIDFGATLSTITIVDNGDLKYVFSAEIGGETLTKAEAKGAGISPADAETKKVTEGLLEKDAKLVALLITSLKPFVNDIKSSIEYYKKKSGKEVKEIILIGGSSKLKGLVSHLTKELRLSVKLGGSYLREDETTLEYTEAVGLALRGLRRKQDKKDPVIQLRGHVSKLGFPVGEIPAETKETKGYILTNPMEDARLKKLNFQMFALLVIIVLGIGTFVSAYWFRDLQRNERKLSLRNLSQNEVYTYKFDVEALLETNSKKYTEDRIQARFVENDVPSAKGETAAEKSREAAKETLVEGEVLWRDPVKEVTSETGEKITFRWVSYFEEHANRLLASSIEEIADDYTYNSIVKTELVETAEPGEFKMLGEVIITVSEPLDDDFQTNLREIDPDQLEEEPEEEAEKKSLLEILVSPFETLNIEESTSP